MNDAALTERPPNEEEVREASAAVRALAAALTLDGLPFSVKQNDNRVELALSPAIGQLLLDVLTHIARGEMVTVVPYGTELTTKQAADLLNVSRPFLISLLDTAVIPFHRVGSHRRVKSQDLLAYKSERDLERSDALEKLQRLGQEDDAA